MPPKSLGEELGEGRGFSELDLSNLCFPHPAQTCRFLLNPGLSPEMKNSPSSAQHGKAPETLGHSQREESPGKFSFEAG